MTILKTSLRSSLLIFAAAASSQAFAFSTMNCLRDLIPLTERGAFQRSRKSVERPFFVNDKFLIFPEIDNTRLQGFFVYANDRAWYFDAVKIGSRTTKISDLTFSRENGILELVAQPEGLETISIFYMPGYDPNESRSKNSVVLGSAVLPVVGSLVMTKPQAQPIYYNPKQATKEELQAWVAKHSGGRHPADIRSVVINQKLAKLVSTEKISGDQLWAPLKQEFNLRRAWVKNNNLDEETFRRFGHVMETSCKQ